MSFDLGCAGVHTGLLNQALNSSQVLQHLLPQTPRNWMQDASGSRGSSGSVAAGDEAALPAVPYQLGYALRDVGVDFQVHGLLEDYRP